MIAMRIEVASGVAIFMPASALWLRRGRRRFAVASEGWWGRPDLNRDCRFRKPVLYPFKQRPRSALLQSGAVRWVRNCT